jgi:diamine N-acetyltransferase
VSAATPVSPTLAIRSARPDEAARVAELMERTFRDTYGGNTTASELEKYVATHFGAEPQRRELTDPGLVTLVAEPTTLLGAPLVALAQLRPESGRSTPECVAAARPAEIARFYVDRPWHGRGVAGPLMDACAATAAAAGADALWLMVYRINARAIAFYQKQGFAPVGTAPFRFGDEIHEDVVMVRSIGPA